MPDLRREGPLAAVGVGFGGPVDWRTGRIRLSHQIEGWSEFDLAGWLGEIAKRRPEQAMSELPPEATDPFLTPERRLKNLLALYRFDGGAKLIDWAVAQSGLDDPLSRFNRTELEAFFKTWSMDRDLALHRLVSDFRRRRVAIDALLVDAPRNALGVLQRFDKVR